MYQVLLVDDEALILSGIKFMIDWAKNDCQIVDTARNGQQGLEKILALHPDIVICDIAMPVMSGTELLQRAAAEAPDTVFLMLTNHPDFHLAQQSLRYRAVDYLLKSDLDADTLEKALALARAECASRAKLARVDLVDDYLESNRHTLLENSFMGLLQAQPGSVGSVAGVFAEHGVLSGYAVAYLPLCFDAIPDYAHMEEAERTRLLAWVKEVCEKVAGAVFPNCEVFSPDLTAQSAALFLFCWGLAPGQWEAQLGPCAEKLTSACATITQVSAAVLGTTRFEGAQDLPACQKQLFALRDTYYLNGNATLFYADCPPVEWGRLALTGLAERLAAELRAKNLAACTALMDKAIDRVRTIPHQQSQAIWLCSEIFSVTAERLGRNNTAGRRELEHLSTRSRVLSWLEQTRNELADLLSQSAASGCSALIEQARQYVQDNVEKRIMLQDVADHICISPGYLSALFKKQYNQNFVDYINEVKTNRACELIKEGRYRVYEISYMLGFENAYYFTRVFKRHTGLTPTEYQKRQTGAH